MMSPAKVFMWAEQHQMTVMFPHTSLVCLCSGMVYVAAVMVTIVFMVAVFEGVLSKLVDVCYGTLC